jgi:hypothetical protein
LVVSSNLTPATNSGKVRFIGPFFVVFRPSTRIDTCVTKGFSFRCPTLKRPDSCSRPPRDWWEFLTVESVALYWRGLADSQVAAARGQVTSNRAVLQESSSVATGRIDWPFRRRLCTSSSRGAVPASGATSRCRKRGTAVGDSLNLSPEPPIVRRGSGSRRGAVRVWPADRRATGDRLG